MQTNSFTRLDSEDLSTLTKKIAWVTEKVISLKYYDLSIVILLWQNPQVNFKHHTIEEQKCSYMCAKDFETYLKELNCNKNINTLILRPESITLMV